MNSFKISAHTVLFTKPYVLHDLRVSFCYRLSLLSHLPNTVYTRPDIRHKVRTEY